MNIKEVSQKTALTADTLRYYEKIGLIPPITRTSGGIRDFNQNHLQWILFTKDLRQAGLSIDSILNYIALYRKHEDTEIERKEILQQQKKLLVDKIDELTTTLNFLSERIDHHQEFVEKIEEKLPCFDPSQCVAS
ncbi:MerR family transcriptional regulator [Enterococcus alishanensis]|uniref:MerR family transcriptional regulator n=1 Tax=Enterococcus alishanensis TaxID=1303817 RepID=A0ABS6TGF9_9ENTE|nr:MerR family transcriptional regulator [Enterococcus alishanensis]MBV7391976.1 MerR family transcriptional regulator [Enterococcus alishanensis]